MIGTAEDANGARRRRDGDSGRDALIADHLSFARALARRYQAKGEPLDDLYQVAAVGLLQATLRWDPERGSSFRAFAAPTILGELRRHFRDKTWTVRPPRSVQELSLSLAPARESWLAKTGRPPTAAQLAEQLGRDHADVDEAMQAAQGRAPESLDGELATARARGRGGIALLGRRDRGYDAVEAAAAAERLVGTLDERSREILRLRFEEELSQKAIGLRVGLSQAHVGRVIAGSLEHLHRVACGCG